MIAEVTGGGAGEEERGSGTRPDILYTLRTLIGTTTYKSLQQAAMISTIFDGKSYILTVARKSDGKSMAFYFPCRLAISKVTMFIVPLLLIKGNVEHKCEVYGIPCVVFGEDTDYQSAVDSGLGMSITNGLGNPKIMAGGD